MRLIIKWKIKLTRQCLKIDWFLKNIKKPISG